MDSGLKIEDAPSEASTQKPVPSANEAPGHADACERVHDMKTAHEPPPYFAAALSPQPFMRFFDCFAIRAAATCRTVRSS